MTRVFAIAIAGPDGVGRATAKITASAGICDGQNFGMPRRGRVDQPLAEFYMDVRARRIRLVQPGSPVLYVRRIGPGSVGWVQSVRGAGCFLGIGGRTEISV